MSSMQIYLTIDDVPSMHLSKKVDFLKSRKIPCVFYARGEFIEKYPDQLIYAIRQGFLIGNHSYSHPYFSEIDLDTCFQEILRTEKLIEACYLKANVLRPQKIFRFPFGDRGVHELQAFLKEQGFTALNFPKVQEGYVDALWDWDVQDYKPRFIENSDLYLKELEDFYKTYPHPAAVMLLHDFDHTHHLFETTIDFLVKKGVVFKL